MPEADGLPVLLCRAPEQAVCVTATASGARTAFGNFHHGVQLCTLTILRKCSSGGRAAGRIALARIGASPSPVARYAYSGQHQSDCARVRRPWRLQCQQERWRAHRPICPGNASTAVSRIRRQSSVPAQCIARLTWLAPIRSVSSTPTGHHARERQSAVVRATSKSTIACLLNVRCPIRARCRPDLQHGR